MASGRLTTRLVTLAALLSACVGRISVSAPGPVPKRGNYIERPSKVDPIGVGHVMRAQHFVLRGDYGEAIPHLRMALIYDDASAYLHEQLVVAWAETGDHKQARATLKQGLAKQPGHPGLNLLAAKRADADGKRGQAGALFAVAAQDPQLLPDAGPRWVNTLFWQGKVGKARARVRDLAQRDPQNPHLVAGLAGIAADHGQEKLALKLYAQARRSQPGDLRLVAEQLGLLEAAGRWAEAAATVRETIPFHPESVDLYLLTARLLRRAGSQEASGFFDAAKAMAVGDIDAQAAIANAYWEAGDAAVGVATLGSALTKDEDPYLRSLLVNAMLEQRDPVGCQRAVRPAKGIDGSRGNAWCATLRGDGAAAERALTTAVAQAGGEFLLEAAEVLYRTMPRASAHGAIDRLAAVVGAEADAYRLRAHAWIDDRHGELEAAHEWLRQVPDDDPVVALDKAYLTYRRGQRVAALTTLREMVRRDPFDPDRLNALGFLLADSNQHLDEAGVYLRRANRLAPDEAHMLDSLGFVHYRRGDYATAARLMGRAHELDSTDPERMQLFAEVMAARGHVHEATALLRRALDYFPGTTRRSDIQRRLGELSQP